MGAEADLRAFLELASEFSLDVVYPFGFGALVEVLLEREGREPAAALLAMLEPSRCDPESTLY